jgi:hypothetical protein
VSTGAASQVRNSRKITGRVSTCAAPVRWDGTVTARWRHRLAGATPDARRHWRTRTSYYAAVSRLIAAGKSRPAWSDIIEAAQPRGSRSTFYEIIGSHAKHALLDDLLAQDTVDTMQLAFYYRRVAAVDRLIDEAKVWAYWPYRESVLRRYRTAPHLDEQDRIDLLTAALNSWVWSNPGLARALHYAPPICAVEDLLLLQPGQYSVVHAVGVLRRVIQGAIDMPVGAR